MHNIEMISHEATLKSKMVEPAWAIYRGTED